MDLLELLLAITIAGICAAIAEFIVGYSPGSILLVMLVGVVGAYLGNGFAIALDRVVPIFPALVLVHVGTVTFSVVWAILGSCLILLVLSLLRGGRRHTIFVRTGDE